MVQTNPFERAARARKVTRLVTVLLAADCDADAAERMDGPSRRLAAQAASYVVGEKINPPSAETWAEVVAALREHERAACGVAR